MIVAVHFSICWPNPSGSVDVNESSQNVIAASNNALPNIISVRKIDFLGMGYVSTTTPVLKTETLSKPADTVAPLIINCIMNKNAITRKNVRFEYIKKYRFKGLSAKKPQHSQ